MLKKKQVRNQGSQETRKESGRKEGQMEVGNEAKTECNMSIRKEENNIFDDKFL